MRKHKFLYLFLGLILGLGLTYGIIAHGAASDAWNIGDGWLWFATASDSTVKSNVDAPVDAKNVANKSYVDAADNSSQIKHWSLKITTETYSGALGGYDGANQKCQDEFGQSAYFNCSSLLVNSISGGSTYIWATKDMNQSAWLGSQIIEYNGNLYLSGKNSCESWTSTANNGGRLTASGGYIEEVAYCAEFLPLCCGVANY